MSRRYRGKTALLVMLTCTISAPVLAFGVMTAINNSSAYKYSDVQDYMLQTIDGRILTLPLEENPISIVLNNVPEEDRKSVFEAIKSLDEISTNIDYTLLENDSVTIKNKIYITGVDELNEGHIGETTYTFDAYTAKLNYPFYIEIDFDKCYNYISDITGENAVSGVVKHELMHTLGFDDLYEKGMANESIMWHMLNLEDYTEGDRNRIRRVYGGESETLDSSTRNYLEGFDSNNQADVSNALSSCIYVSYPNTIQISALEEEKNKIKNNASISEPERTM